MGCRAPTRVTFPSTAAELPLSGSLRQTRAKDVACGHDCPHSLLMSGQGGTVTGDELAQQDIATTQRLHGLKAFEKTLSSGHRLEASGATQPVPNGDMATSMLLVVSPRRRCRPVRMWVAPGNSPFTAFT